MVDITRLLNVIKRGELSQAQLQTQYKNVVSYPDLSESDLELFVSALEDQLRIRFPAAAKKIFGAKDAGAREILLNIDKKIKQQHDLSKNRLKDGVKTGGDMISGRKYLSVYISYKNSSNFGASFVLEQDTLDSELTAVINKYKTGGKDKGTIEKRTFGIDAIEEAKKLYRTFISDIIEV